MNRTAIINRLIEENRYQTYLEIGVRNPKQNFLLIEVPNKVGIDPALKPSAQSGWSILSQKSDAYFEQLGSNEAFDLIFIDGDHQVEQVARDVDNSLHHLATNGTIVMHDCYPITAKEADPLLQKKGNWCGEVYKVFLKLRQRNDLLTYCYNCDHGVGIVRKGENATPLVLPQEISFEQFFADASKLLGLRDPIDNPGII